jgi:hypothetical protein
MSMRISHTMKTVLLNKIGLATSALLCSSFFCGTVLAQRADVPRADRYGNFLSTRMQGNRGVYQQTYWLVVDRDPAGLNCRLSRQSFRGRASQNEGVALQRGAIIKADHSSSDDEAISIVDGKTWLRVVVHQNTMHYDARRERRNEPYSCYVRANSAFIAPINVDDLMEINFK